MLHHSSPYPNVAVAYHHHPGRCNTRIAASMAPPRLSKLLLGVVAWGPSIAMALGNATFSDVEMLRAQLALLDDRPPGCPPWYEPLSSSPNKSIKLICALSSFNCLLPAHTCSQYADCNEYNGKCDCPDGFGGDDCLEPCMSIEIRRYRTKLTIGNSMWFSRTWKRPTDAI